MRAELDGHQKWWNSALIVALVTAIGLVLNSLISSGFFADKTVCLIHEADVKRLNDAAENLQQQQARLDSHLLDMTEFTLDFSEKATEHYRKIITEMKSGKTVPDDDIDKIVSDRRRPERADTSKVRDASNDISALVTEFFRRCPR